MESFAIIITLSLDGNNRICENSLTAMEKSPSWSRAHDWKSCKRLKRFEGSNPSFSAKKKQVFDLFLFLFFTEFFHGYVIVWPWFFSFYPAKSCIFTVILSKNGALTPLPHQVYNVKYVILRKIGFYSQSDFSVVKF